MRAEEVEKGSNSRRHLLPVRNDGVDSNLRAALPFENEREAGSPLRTRYAGDSQITRRIGRNLARDQSGVSQPTDPDDDVRATLHNVDDAIICCQANLHARIPFEKQWNRRREMHLRQGHRSVDSKHAPKRVARRAGGLLRGSWTRSPSSVTETARVDRSNRRTLSRSSS